METIKYSLSGSIGLSNYFKSVRDKNLNIEIDAHLSIFNSFCGILFYLSLIIFESQDILYGLKGEEKGVNKKVMDSIFNSLWIY